MEEQTERRKRRAARAENGGAGDMKLRKKKAMTVIKHK